MRHIACCAPVAAKEEEGPHTKHIIILMELECGQDPPGLQLLSRQGSVNNGLHRRLDHEMSRMCILMKSSLRTN